MVMQLECIYSKDDRALLESILSEANHYVDIGFEALKLRSKNIGFDRTLIKAMRQIFKRPLQIQITLMIIMRQFR